jgi:uncharacterized oxidoreductase
MGYKGFGLSLLVEILAGALSGAGCSNSEVYRSRPFYGGNGVFLMAINVGRLTNINAFKRRVENLFRTIQISSRAPGVKEILIPGELEQRTRKHLLLEGIYIEEKTWKDIEGLCRELNVEIP